MLTKSRRLLGLPVVSLADGQQLGRIRAPVVDPKTLTVVALMLDPGGLFREHRLVPFKAVRNVGEHAVTVDDANAVKRLSEVPELAPLVRQAVNLLGARVISEDGRFWGHTEEYLVDATGNIDHFVIHPGSWQALARGKGLLPARAVRAAGPASLVIRAEAVEEINWEGGTLKNFQEYWRRILGPEKDRPVPPPEAQG
ncbi:MAG: PRC-barrel domain-containing protein [Moorellales bacterium]